MILQTYFYKKPFIQLKYGFYPPTAELTSERILLIIKIDKSIQGYSGII